MKVAGRFSYKSQKLTVDQKALKKAIGPVARDIKNQVKAGMPKLTGALQFSIDYRVYSIKGSAKAVIGVKNRYSRKVKGGKVKIPNLYARKINDKYHVLERFVNQDAVDRLRDEVARVKDDLLKSK
jgi:hypothetical protein